VGHICNSFFLALLTKEVSVALPLIVLVDLWSSSDGTAATKASWRNVAMGYGLDGGTFGCFSARWCSSNCHRRITRSRNKAAVDAPKILLFDLYRVVFPVGLSHTMIRPVESGGMKFCSRWAFWQFWCGLPCRGRRNRELWVAYAWLVFPLLPSTNLGWMNQDDFVHDRYMYISMLGVALLAGSPSRPCGGSGLMPVLSPC